MIALFLGSAYATRLRQSFADGVEDDGQLFNSVSYDEHGTHIGESLSQAPPAAAAKTEKKAAEPAKKETKKADKAAAKKAAPAKDAKKEEKKEEKGGDAAHGDAVGCNPGETRGKDGICYFEAEALTQHKEPVAYENGPPEKVETFNPPRSNHHTTFFHQAPPTQTIGKETKNDSPNQIASQQTMAQAKFDPNSEPEKIHTLVPESYQHTPTEIVNNPHQRTTFYDQQPSEGDFVQFDANQEPEKIHTLIPESYRTLSNDEGYFQNLGTQRTAFFAQTGENMQFNANQEPEKIHTLVPESYKTLSDDGSYFQNLGTQRTAFYAQKPVYDEKNGLWRQAMPQKEDIINNSHIDPWVHEFSQDQVKDLRNNNKSYENRADAPKSLAQQ